MPFGDKGRASAPAPFRRQLARIGPKSLAGIARRDFQGAQHRSRGQGEAGFHHGGIHIAPARNAAAKPTAECVMAFNPAGDILALNQASQHRRRCRPAIPPRRVSAASFPARGGGNARKPDNAIPKAKGFAIKNANLCGLGRHRAIRGRRAEKIGRQAKTKGHCGDQRA